MLTGDKLETATCTAKNAHLITRNQDIHIFRPVSAGQGPLFLLYAYEVVIVDFSTTGFVPVQCCTDNFLTPLTYEHPSSVRPRPVSLWSQRPTQLRMQLKPAQLNKSPPTSESIQATVKENKQAFAQTERRTQLNHSQREHAEGSLPNLFCRFQALSPL